MHEDPRIKISKQDNTGIHRQHHVNQIHHRIKRSCLTNFTGDCSQNTRDLQQVQAQSHLSPCTRSEQCRSRQTIDEVCTNVREESPKQDVPGFTEVLGPDEDRRICKPSQQEVTEILQPIFRLGSMGSGCFSPKMVNDRSVLSSTLGTNSKSVTLCQEIDTEENSTGDPRLAHPVLVPHGTKDETIGRTNNLQTRENEVNRLAIIREVRRIQGLTAEESMYLEDCIREGTARAYVNG